MTKTNKFGELIFDHDDIFDLIMQDLKSEDLINSLELKAEGDSLVKYINLMADNFRYPGEFEKCLSVLDKELLPVTNKILKKLENSQGLSNTLLCQTFELAVGAFDDCIKKLLESSDYKDQLKLKFQYFGELLEKYLEILLKVYKK